MPTINPILDVFWTLRTLDAAVLDVAYFGCCGFGRFDTDPSRAANILAVSCDTDSALYQRGRETERGKEERGR